MKSTKFGRITRLNNTKWNSCYNTITQPTESNSSEIGYLRNYLGLMIVLLSDKKRLNYVKIDFHLFFIEHFLDFFPNLKLLLQIHFL